MILRVGQVGETTKVGYFDYLRLRLALLCFVALVGVRWIWAFQKCRSIDSTSRISMASCPGRITSGYHVGLSPWGKSGRVPTKILTSVPFSSRRVSATFTLACFCKTTGASRIGHNPYEGIRHVGAVQEDARQIIAEVRRYSVSAV